MGPFPARNNISVANEMHTDDIPQQMRGKWRRVGTARLNCVKSEVACSFDIEETTIQKNTLQLSWSFSRLGNYLFSSFLSRCELSNAE